MKIATLKKTHIQRVRESNAAQLTDICRLLGWSKQKYCRHQFYEYQQMVMELSRGCSDARRKRIEYSPLFRGFFNNEWEQRNTERFMPFAEEWWFDRRELVREYYYQHDHFILLANDGFKDRLNYRLNLI